MDISKEIETIISGLEIVSVIKADPNPYSMQGMPTGPKDPERVEDGYGLVMPNKPNQQAETDKHPEFHTKTELVQDPDYGQGTTMNVGINL